MTGEDGSDWLDRLLEWQERVTPYMYARHRWRACGIVWACDRCGALDASEECVLASTAFLQDKIDAVYRGRRRAGG